MNANMIKPIEEMDFGTETIVTSPHEDHALEAGQTSLTRQLTSPAVTRHCPECRSIIYSRRHKLCGVCACELPREFLFSVEEASRLQNLLRNEQARHREWMRKSLN